jgi:serine/threonine protein kinase
MNEQTLRSFLRERFPEYSDQLELDDDLSSVVDSLGLFELVAFVETEFKLTIPTAVDFAYQTASALGAAHAKGIVHRDLKPDNLFVVPDPHDSHRERVKVLDFGIAKLQQGSVADSVKTRTGTLMGTPIYM